LFGAETHSQLVIVCDELIDPSSFCAKGQFADKPSCGHLSLGLISLLTGQFMDYATHENV